MGVYCQICCASGKEYSGCHIFGSALYFCLRLADMWQCCGQLVAQIWQTGAENLRVTIYGPNKSGPEIFSELINFSSLGIFGSLSLRCKVTAQEWSEGKTVCHSLE